MSGSTLADQIRWLVVSDLDGTMLNHDSYDMAAAKEAISRLQKNAIPLILNTSKTCAETIAIRDVLGITDPFIVENGSAIYLPKDNFEKPLTASSSGEYWVIVMGESKKNISDVLSNINTADDNYTRLSQCSVEQAVALTGLSEVQAELAIARDYSEPLLWHSDEMHLRKFQQQLARSHLTTLQGGRFLHVIGDCDKGRSTQRLLECYQGKVKVVALGDSANDAALLTMADVSVMVNSPSNHQLQGLMVADIVTRETAPQGWKDAIDEVFDRVIDHS